MASLNELKMSMTHYTMAYSRDKYYFVEQISNRYGFPIMNFTVLRFWTKNHSGIKMEKKIQYGTKLLKKIKENTDLISSFTIFIFSLFKPH